MGIIKVAMDIILGIIILAGIWNSFNLEGEEQATEIIVTTILIIIEMLLIGG